MKRDGVATGETRGGQTKAAILRAARERFAAQGYERTTIRGVAADAGIDPSMVMRYFGNKEGLFDAALAVDLRLPDLAAVPAGELAQALVRHFVERWEGDPADDALLVLLRSAVTHEAAAARMREVFAAQVAPALGPDRGERVAGLVATQLLGLALTRYLLRLPPMAGLSPEEVIAAVSPGVAAVL
ncbi:TetR family transcriptional regulator [Streptomyces sp. NPDC002886]|uniref:TetR/AcrR family transcriptional regulator n=1 Tax=Streptomyces sp. NPDC002886 TaxID=3364667 RepID=UPI0036B36A8D